MLRFWLTMWFWKLVDWIGYWIGNTDLCIHALVKISSLNHQVGENDMAYHRPEFVYHERHNEWLTRVYCTETHRNVMWVDDSRTVCDFWPTWVSRIGRFPDPISDIRTKVLSITERSNW